MRALRIIWKRTRMLQGGAVGRTGIAVEAAHRDFTTSGNRAAEG